MLIIPKKLSLGDEIRIIAPARSLALLTDKLIQQATKKLEEQEFKVTFSKHCQEVEMFISASIESRVDDIHEAFHDKNVAGILTVIGGFNSNQLLPYLNYDLIRENPKILCGYSDITALCHAITTQTGLITYSGLHFSTWAMEQESEYNKEYFRKCLMGEEEYTILPSPTWSDDAWYRDQENRNIQKNDGFFLIQQWEAEGVIFWGNLCTLNLLQGTRFMPNIGGSLLFLEDDGATGDDFAVEFDRNLESLLQQPGYETIQGLVIGRFQKKAKITMEELRYIIRTKKALKNIPIIANVDIWHTNPMITFPIGGTARLLAASDKIELTIVSH